MNPETSEAHCNTCRTWKAREDFYANARNPNGLQYKCKACFRSYYRARRQDQIEYNRQHRWEDQRVRMASDARRRDRAAGRETDIRAKDIVIPEVCPDTGCLLWHGVGEKLGWSPCLVRIDKTKGYVPGNWRVVANVAVEPTTLGWTASADQDQAT